MWVAPATMAVKVSTSLTALTKQHKLNGACLSNVKTKKY